MSAAASFTLIDITALAVVAISALLAGRHGFVQSILGIGVWVGAALAALYGYDPAHALVVKLSGGAGFWTGLFTSCGLFAAALIVFSLIRGAFVGALRNSVIGPLDRALGFLFGAARGAVLLCIAWIGATLVWSSDGMPRIVTQSWSIPYIRAATREGMASLLPDAVDLQIRDSAETARQRKADADALLRLSPAPTAADRHGVENVGVENGAAPAFTEYSTEDKAALERLIEEEG